MSHFYLIWHCCSSHNTQTSRHTYTQANINPGTLHNPPTAPQQGLNTYLSSGLQCAPQPAALQQTGWKVATVTRKCPLHQNRWGWRRRWRYREVCVWECVRQTGGSELPGRHFSQQHIHTHIRDHTHIRITFPSHIQSQDQPINPPGAVFFLETSKTGPDLHSSIKPHDTYALHTCKRKPALRAPVSIKVIEFNPTEALKTPLQRTERHAPV